MTKTSERRRSRLVRLALAVAVALICAGALASAGAAANCGSKCYGAAQWNPNAYWGTIAYLNARALHVSDHCQAFATDTSWIDDQNWSTGFGSWIEQGLINGFHPPQPPGSGNCWGLWYYWAEDNLCGDFYVEYWGGPAYNTDFAARIHNLYGSGGEWQLLRNGSPLGYVNCHPGPIVYASAGLEADGNVVFNADVLAHNFQKMNASFGWSYGWPNSYLVSTGAAGAIWCGSLCVQGWLNA